MAEYERQSGMSGGRGGYTASGGVQAVTQQAQDTAAQLTRQVQETARPQLESQKERVVEQLSFVGSALRDTSRSLHGRQQGQVAQFIDMGADQIERVTEYLQDHELTELMDEAHRFARQQPAVFVAGAFALGLLAARFIKSSSQPSHGYGGQGYNNWQSGQGWQGNAGSWRGNQSQGYGNQVQGYRPGSGQAQQSHGRGAPPNPYRQDSNRPGYGGGANNGGPAE